MFSRMNMFTFIVGKTVKMEKPNTKKLNFAIVNVIDTRVILDIWGVAASLGHDTSM